MRKRRATSVRQRAGFTLLEAVVSTLIVAILLVAGLQTAGSSSLAQYKAAERATARFLADGLMTDILPLAYEDPDTSPLFGREAGEPSTSRANYDDVDDFNGWTESPPQDKDGNSLPGMAGWRRSVSVEWVGSTDVNQVASGETGAKRITVTVQHNNVTVATRVAVRTRAP